MKRILTIVTILCAALLLFACDTSIEQAASTATALPSEAAEGQAASPEVSQTATPEPTAQATQQPENTPTPAPTPEPIYSAIPLPEEVRAMWISFFEWQEMDISTEEAMRQTVIQIFDHCKQMGLNTVIVAVHPFNDALYNSEYFPWSHLIGEGQGTDPGYDPLAVMLEEAHARGLRVEAWINPYRVQHPEHGPATLSEDNPAVLNPSWVREQGGLWLDPGLPEVRELVVACVTEIVANYDVDGIHIDDYFYPEGNTSAFDADTYAQYGNGMELSEWRRENVNEMARSIYAAIKEQNPSVSFGVSPQGNNENNYNQQYCDIKLWMAEAGYADYIMPQLYWGFNYTSSIIGNAAAFNNKVAEWSGYPLHEDVKLYAGLGAYRIGEGDGSSATKEEWNSGHNLAEMVATLREAGGFDGFALFHYLSLFPLQADDPYYALAASEVTALTAKIQEPAQPEATETPIATETPATSQLP